MKSKSNPELTFLDDLIKHQKSDNSDCLKAYYELIDAGKECSKLVEEENNLVRIFFYDLMAILTTYLLKKNLINSSFRPPEWILEYNKTDFPYISYHDILGGIKLEEKIYNNAQQSVGIKKFLFKCICNVLIKIFPNRDLIGIGYQLPLGYMAHFRLLLDFNLHFLDHTRISIMRLDEQISILNKRLDLIIKFDENNNDVESLKKIINNHLRLILKYDKDTKKYNFIIIGSPNESINRIHSVLAKRNKIPVISFMHGAGDQTMYNEPKLGYSESSFVDYIIGYGESGIDYENSSYVRGFTSPPKFIGCSSSTISNIYKTDKTKKINKVSDCKWMYVPDSGQLIRQHGPYGASINTLLYFKWQKQIINSFPGVLYKKHPKGDPVFRSITDEQMVDFIGINREEIHIITDNFTDVYSECDGFIFDTVSTAFMIAVATDKPIIYFNIGKRKFTELAEKKIKERCLWIDIMDGEVIDIDNMEKILSAKNFTNNITNNYSLTKSVNKTRQDALFSLIQTF